MGFEHQLTPHFLTCVLSMLVSVFNTQNSSPQIHLLGVANGACNLWYRQYKLWRVSAQVAAPSELRATGLGLVALGLDAPPTWIPTALELATIALEGIASGVGE